MGRRRLWAAPITRLLVLPTVLAAAMLAGAGAAVAVPEPQWQGGQFLRAGAPVYPEPVDGWICHLGGPCRDSTEREPDDPPPIWHSVRIYQRIEVECYLGRYYKIHEFGGERREGWALDSDVDTSDRVKPCRATDF